MQSARADNLPLAIGAMLVMTSVMSFGDAVIKGAADTISLWQLFVLRSAILLPVLALLALIFARAADLRPRAFGWICLRGGLLVANWIAFYAALPLMPFPLVAATLYSVPLFTTLFAALLIGETITPLRWAAVGVGFTGVLLVIQPGGSGFGWGSLLPLAGAVFYALSSITTRAKCRDEHPLTLAFVLNVIFVATGALGALAFSTEGGASFLTFAWRMTDMALLQEMALLAVFLGVSSIATAIAFQSGPSSVVGPLDFTYIGFAVLWGWLLYGEVPGALATGGIGLIVLGGIVAIRAR